MELAFSSRIIVKRLRERGIEVPTEQGALENSSKKGIHIFM